MSKETPYVSFLGSLLSLLLLATVSSSTVYAHEPIYQNIVRAYQYEVLLNATENPLDPLFINVDRIKEMSALKCFESQQTINVEPLGQRQIVIPGTALVWTLQLLCLPLDVYEK